MEVNRITNMFCTRKACMNPLKIKDSNSTRLDSIIHNSMFAKETQHLKPILFCHFHFHNVF